MKVVINVCFGGFGLSDEAYEKLIEYGVPVRKHVEQKRDPKTMLYMKEPLNEGEVIFDRDFDDKTELNDAMRSLSGRYWDSFLSRENRDHPLLVRVVEELGERANGKHASLKVVEIPDGTGYTIEEYDGNEHVAEVHNTWS